MFDYNQGPFPRDEIKASMKALSDSAVAHIPTDDPDPSGTATQITLACETAEQMAETLEQGSYVVHISGDNTPVHNVISFRKVG